MAGPYDVNFQPTPMNGPVPGFNPNNAAISNYLSGNTQQMTTPGLGANIAGSITAPQIPGVTPGVTPGSNALNTPLGPNLGTANLILGGLGTIGNLWMSFQAQKLAKEQFAFQKDMTNANFANQLQAYNTTLTDKINARTAQEGGDSADAQKYVDNNKLEDNRKTK